MNSWFDLRKVIRRHFRQLSIVTVCNVAMQVISVIGFVFIARLYQAEQVGEYLIFIAYVGIISILSTGYYDQALYVEKRFTKVRLLKLIPIGFAFIISIPVGLALYLADVPYVPYILVAGISSGINKTAVNINISQNKLIFTSIYRLITAPLVPGFIIAVAFLLEAKSEWMIATYSMISLVISIIFYLMTNPFKEMKFDANLRGTLILSLALIRRYRKFFFYGMFGELIGTAAYRMPVILISSFFGVTYAAYFGVAMRVVLTPTSVLCGTVSQMFLHKISANKKNNIASMNTFLKSFALLSIVGMLASLVCVTVASPIIVMLFTDKYAMVGEVVFWLAPLIFSLIAISPLGHVLTIYEKQEYPFYNKIAQLVLSVASFSIGFYFDSFLLGVQGFSLSMTLIYLVIMGQNIHVLLNYDSAYKNKLEHKHV